MQLLGTPHSRLSIFSTALYATMLDSRALLEKRTRIVAASTITSRPKPVTETTVSSGVLKTIRAKASLSASLARKEREHAASQITMVVCERNPRAIREERMREQRRLAAEQKAIEAEIRTRRWNR